MIGALEPPERRAEYCLKKLEEVVQEMEQMGPAARESERGINLAKQVEYWDRMIFLAALGSVNPDLTQWARDNLNASSNGDVK